MNRVWGIILLGIFALYAISCNENPDITLPVTTTTTSTGGTTLATVASVRISPASSFTLSVGGTQQLTATAYDASNAAISNLTFIWSSSNTSNATVSSTGLVTAVSPGGPVNITASSGNITSSAISVTVSCTGIPSNTPTPIAVTLNPISPINVNATTSVLARVYDCNGTPVPDNTTVTFTVTPSNLGSVNPLSPSTPSTSGGTGSAETTFTAGGTAGTVTIAAASGTASGSATLAIQALPVLGIKFDQADPQVIGVKGSGQTEVSKVSFSVKDTQGNPIANGTVVKFQFLSGYNPGGGAAIDPLEVATLDGIASTFLKSGFVAGPVRILAFIDKDDDDQFDPGEIYTTSTPLSIGGGVPSMRFFSVSADVHNLAGRSYDDQEANITVKLADRFGNYNVLEATSVSFYTEGGAIADQGLTDNQGETHVVLRTQNRQPVDTDPRQKPNPIGNEIFLYNNINCSDFDPAENFNANFEDLDGDGVHDTCEHFSDLDGGGYDLMEPNPRDGWVSILATTQGEETFYDLNGNGLYDPGEAFDDNGGEPFVDENDNGMYDDKEDFEDKDFNGSYTPGEVFYDKGRGEPFLDVNNNGVRDATEPFTDLNGNLTYDGPGDAWFDANGNGVYDTGEPCKDYNNNGTLCTTASDLGGFHNFVYDPGEKYIDVNGDGKWTHGNGVWDSNTTLWVDLRRPNQTSKVSQIIVFTGPPDFSNETSKIVVDELHRDPRPGQGAAFWIHNGECASFDIHVADINNNMLIPGTKISIVAENALLVGQSSFTVPDNIGGGPTILSVQVCDNDVSKIEMKKSSLTVNITWTPQNVEPLAATMVVFGTKDAPFTLPVTISTTSLPSATVTCTTAPCYNVTLNATGGATPYTWVVSSGLPPPNFSLDSTTGKITQNGNSIAGTYNFTVTITDILGTTAAQPLSITVQ